MPLSFGRKNLAGPTRCSYRSQRLFSMRCTVVLGRETDGGYVATVPALPGCVSRCDTRDENTSNALPPVHSEAADGFVRPVTAKAAPSGRICGEPLKRMP